VGSALKAGAKSLTRSATTGVEAHDWWEEHRIGCSVMDAGNRGQGWARLGNERRPKPFWKAVAPIMAAAITCVRASRSLPSATARGKDCQTNFTPPSAIAKASSSEAVLSPSLAFRVHGRPGWRYFRQEGYAVSPSISFHRGGLNSATNARCARFSSMLDLAVLIAAQGEDACEIRLLRFLRDF
jgi:hypothetical protein